MHQIKRLNFRTKKWFEINDESHRVYDTGSQITFKTSMLRSSYVIIVMHIYMLKKLYQ